MDIFALGCVLSELLTGQRAFDGKSASNVMAAILATEPRRVTELVPPSLFAKTNRQRLRLYLAAGTFETGLSDSNQGHYLLATNRHMRDVLVAKQYDFGYVEFSANSTGRINLLRAPVAVVPVKLPSWLIRRRT